ncbi:MAG TPA: alpha/beta fold hydrolase [Kineosporiaceae bacterium]|nr:alpha/beta fold hydrolase [Kineosporiaceae bacterium]
MTPALIERLAAVPEAYVDARPWSLSPDGRALAFAWRRDGDWHVYLTDLYGAEPRRVESFDDACLCPLFSPDGAFLYFARDDRGTECYDVYRYTLADGTLVNLLPDTPELAPAPDFALSPDGRTLAVSVNHGQSQAAAVMPVDGGASGLRMLTDHWYNDWSPVFSPDGRLLAFASDTHGQDSAVFVATVDGTGLQAVGGEAMLQARDPAWSPDGRLLAFCGGPDQHEAIGLYDVAAGLTSWVWRGDGNAHAPAWSPDGRALAFVVDDGPENSLRHVDLASGAERAIDFGPGNHYRPGFTRDGAGVICTHSGPGGPTDLFLIDLASGDARRLTDSLPADLAGHHFVSGIPAVWTSRDRLAEVPGLFCAAPRPTGAGVVIIHGGPTWHHSNEWDPVRQALLDAGCHVVHPNYRGSDGDTRRWQLANRYLLGQGEAQDCAGAVDFLVAEGCDPARIAVTGRSHGGYLTMQMVTQFPELWACGVAGVPFFDHIDAQLDPAVRGDLVWWDVENCGDIHADRARLEYYSPINHLERVKAPLLILAAACDPRCPTRQIDTVVERVRAAGTPCEAMIYPDEGHEISSLEHRVDYERRTVEFILEHVGRR